MYFENEPIWLLALALLPPLALMIFVYLKDKHKDSFGILFKLFLFGVLSIIPALIWELIGSAITENLSYDYAFSVFLECFLVIGPAEEICKFWFLRGTTWKNPKFDYMYNGIVFAVFTSLGFAALENVAYVVQNGFETGILRAITSIPGHACFAVFMGYFYSKAKLAFISRRKFKSFIYTVLSWLVPVIIHGAYDFILMVEPAVGRGNTGTLLVIWILFMLVSFTWAFIIVNRQSKPKHDMCLKVAPEYSAISYEPVQTSATPLQTSASPYAAAVAVPASAADTGWTCSCGQKNYYEFCSGCGSRKPAPEPPKPAEPVSKDWICPNCGGKSEMNFCQNCGTARPVSRG